MIVMLFSSSAVFAEDAPGGGSIIFDVILVRPLGVATLALGTAFFVVSLPFGVTSGSTGKAAKVLIAEPFNFTFARPLGEFGYSDAGHYQDAQDNNN